MSKAHLDVLKDISEIGAGNAAAALSNLLMKPVRMKVSRVLPMPFKDITEYIGGAENLVNTVFLRFEGDIAGNMFFIIEMKDAKSLVEDMTGMIVEGDFSELALSVLQEVGNILSGSYLTALADYTAMELRTTVPSLSIDMAGALLSFGLMETGRFSDYAIMIDAQIETENQSQTDTGEAQSGYFFLLPDPESFEKLFVALGVQRYGSY